MIEETSTPLSPPVKFHRLICGLPLTIIMAVYGMEDEGKITEEEGADLIKEWVHKGDCDA